MRAVFLISFLDLLLGMLMMVLLMVNPEMENKDAVQPPGNLFVYTTWVDQGDDVDLWMAGPEKTLVGYSIKDSKLCNLVKDDLGTDSDPLKMNYENVFCRKTPDGEYIINVQAYRVTHFPMEVNIQIGLNVNGSTNILFNKKVVLSHPGEEITVIRFRMHDNAVVPGSIHATPIGLRVEKH
jgi:hypothetical protein